MRVRVAADKNRVEIARSVQQRLFPQAAPEIPGFDIAGAAFPAEQTCGDYYDFISMPSDSLGVVMADVSGHGLGPALLMAETRAYLRALAESLTTVEEIVDRTNRFLRTRSRRGALRQHVLRPTLSPTAFAQLCGGWTQRTSFRPAGQRDVLEPTGLVLGIEDDARVASAPEIRLRPGELVLLMTDGLWETRSPDKTMFGMERNRRIRASPSLRTRRGNHPRAL